MKTQTREIALGVAKEVEITAKLFQRQIVEGHKDFRKLEDAYTISHFMLCLGNQLYNADLNLYAALLGFLNQASFWFPNETFYSERDLQKPFNHQLN